MGAREAFGVDCCRGRPKQFGALHYPISLVV